MSVTYKAIDPESGIRWCVRIVFFGDNYGLKHCLTYGDKEFDKKMNEPMIEFYDMDSGAAAIMRNSDDKTEAYLAEEYGQFVGRYYLSSLKFERNSNGKTLTDWSKRGLNLDGGVDRWSVSSEFMVDAMAAIEAELADRAELERIEGMRFMHQGQVIEKFGHLVEASSDDWDAFLDELRGLTYVESKDDGYIVQEIQQ